MNNNMLVYVYFCLYFKMDTIINPFYKTEFVKYRTFKYVYIMCSTKQVDIHDCKELFVKTCSYEKLKEICKLFCLIKVPISILNEYKFKERAMLVDGNMIKNLFNDNEYDINEIIIGLYELNKEQVIKIINMLTPDIDLQNVIEILTLNSCYTTTKIFDPNILPINMYWKNINNCKISLNEIFEDRVMIYEGHRMDKISYKKSSSLNELIENDKHNLYFLNDMYNKTQHINIGTVIKKSKNRTFYMNSIDLTNEYVNDFFENIVNEKHKIYCLIIFITSKEYCHLVINNKHLLQNNIKLFLKYSIVLAYYLGYAWNTLYIEESLLNTKIKKTDRCVFDIDTANKLISFPFTMENVHTNPYVTILLDRKTIEPSNNFMGISSLKEHYKYYGICDKNEAFKRLNIFVSGKSNTNIFEGIGNMFSITGSVMPAILQKLSPLIEQCTNNTMTYDEKYDTFYKKYYTDSDIDIMCSVKNTNTYLKNVTSFIKMLYKNLDIDRKDIEIEIITKPAIIISKYFFQECILDVNDLLGTFLTESELKEKFENKEYDEIIDYIYNDYIENYKETEITDDIDDRLYMSKIDKKDFVLKLSDYCYTKDANYKKDDEQCFYINDFRRKQDYVFDEHNYMVFKICVTTKYKITSKYINRAIEIFRIPEGDPFNTVAKFHKPCVRAYLQNNNIYMLPSFITAMMTLINIDFKYFASSRDPIKIIDKYRDRGFSFIANTNEKKTIVLYKTHVGENMKEKIFGLKYPDLNYINNSKELREHYINYYKYKHKIDISDSMFLYNCISEKGYITPLKMWILDAFCDFIYS